MPHEKKIKLPPGEFENHEHVWKRKFLRLGSNSKPYGYSDFCLVAGCTESKIYNDFEVPMSQGTPLSP